MKVRTCFVSNSSSSSFIVISSDEDWTHMLATEHDTLTFGPKHNGCCEFGWQEEQYFDVFSKINFCYIQCSYLSVDEQEYYLGMLEKVIKEYTGVSEIIWDFPEGNYDWYIDHQSSAEEGENMEMFDSEEHLKMFLFNNNSYIQCDNDNH